MELKPEAIRRDEEGNIAMFRLNDGRVVDFPQCQEMINKGELDLISTTGKNGVDIIRSKPDGDSENNLSQLPEF